MGQGAPEIWSDLYIVRSYDVDARGRLCAAAICNFLQDAAGGHAHALGVSVAQLQSIALTWVLVRLRLRLVRDPVWQDRLRIETWPSQRARLVTQRDFLLTSETGEDVGRCVTSWVLMDLQRWRPQRLTALPHPLPAPVRPRALVSGLEKIPATESTSPEHRFQVGYRDLDRNGHVNHVRYIEWALETVPANVRNTCRLEALAVDFIGEALYEEKILAGSREVETPPPVFRHRLRSRTTGTELARAETRWRPPG